MTDKLITALGLAIVYFATGTLVALTERVERSRALRLWTLGLYCFAVDEASAGLACVLPYLELFRAISWVGLLGGGLFAVAGSFQLLGKSLAVLRVPAMVVAVAFVVAGATFGFDSIQIRILVFSIVGLALLWGAKLLLLAQVVPGVGRWVAASSFVLAGIYAVIWPFVLQFHTVERMEFFFDLSVVLWATAGMFLLHFERARARIQELAQQEIELRAKLEQSERLEALGRLAAGVAHDFNNVLTTVMHGSELVLRQIEDRPKAAEHLRLVLESAEGAAKFTRQLLTLGRRRLPGRKPIVVQTALSSALQMVRPSLPRDVALSVTVADAPVSVLSGEGQIEQILVNLALNAVDAMPQGGRLDIAVGVDAGSRNVTIAVSDTGLGMAVETLPRIFEPFFSTKSGQGGTGLGLAAVYAIVKQLDGHIDVDSLPGKGTNFHVRLPVCVDAPRCLSAASPSVKPECVSILVVDDQEAVLRSVSMGLADEGFKVTLANSAAQALAQAQSQPPSILLTDLAMPEMDGLQLLKALRKRFPGLPAILMTAHSNDAEMESGRFDVLWLPKPFTRQALRTAIDTALEARGARTKIK